MTIESIDTASAEALYEQLPAPLRLTTLSPRFAWADTTREEGLACHHLAFREGDAFWLHSVHLRALTPDPRWRGAISPYGYGGPLANTDDAPFVDAAWRAYTEWCAQNAVIAEFARFHPLARSERYFRGSVALNRQTVVVDLQTPDLAASYSTLTRRKLRRAASAGATARLSTDPADWARYGPFYRGAMAALGAHGRYHFGDPYFESIGALPEARLCICEREGEWLSAGVYLFGAQAVEYHLGANSPAGYASATPHLMQHAAALEGQRLGHSFLYLGGGISPEPDNPLLFHKQGFSDRLVPFFIGQAVHDESAYWAVAGQAGFDRAHPPPRILFD